MQYRHNGVVLLLCAPVYLQLSSMVTFSVRAFAHCVLGTLTSKHVCLRFLPWHQKNSVGLLYKDLYFVDSFFSPLCFVN